MSKRLEVLLAVKAMVARALPDVEVLGLTGDDAAPERIGAHGRVIVRSGDPGEPAMDLSPPVYNYEHAIPIEVSAYATDAGSGEKIVDGMFALIAAAMEADRTLGGAVDYVDAAAPLTDDDETEGAAVLRTGSATLVVTYSTTHPL